MLLYCADTTTFFNSLKVLVVLRSPHHSPYPYIYLQHFPRTLGTPAALVILGFYIALSSILKGTRHIPLHHIRAVAPALEAKQDWVKHLVTRYSSQIPSKNSRPGFACSYPIFAIVISPMVNWLRGSLKQFIHLE